MTLDQRFYTNKAPLDLRTLLLDLGIDAKVPEGTDVSGVSSSETARAGDLCFIEGGAAKAASTSPDATACFVSEAAADGLPETVIPIIVELPRFSHILAARSLFDIKDWESTGPAPAIHPTAQVASNAFVANGVAIGEHARIGPGAVIGPGVQIGARTTIGPNATLRCSLIGNDVTILAGAVVGESGFGVTVGPEGAVDIPQWGRVIVQDHVTIGANTCIDRGAFDDTIIGERTKIDNMVQIAHNVVIGRNVAMASFTGISGTSIIEDGVVMGGRVGIADHVRVGAGAQLAASAGIMRDIPAGEKWGGIPAKPLRQYFREVAWIQRQTAPKKKNAE